MLSGKLYYLLLPLGKPVRRQLAVIIENLGGKVEVFDSFTELTHRCLKKCPEVIFFSEEFLSKLHSVENQAFFNALNEVKVKKVVIKLEDSEESHKVERYFDASIEMPIVQTEVMKALRKINLKKGDFNPAATISGISEPISFKIQADIERVGEFSIRVTGPFYTLREQELKIDSKMFNEMELEYYSLVSDSSRKKYLDKGNYENTFYFKGLAEKDAKKLRKSALKWRTNENSVH